MGTWRELVCGYSSNKRSHSVTGKARSLVLRRFGQRECLAKGQCAGLRPLVVRRLRQSGDFPAKFLGDGCQFWAAACITSLPTRLNPVNSKVVNGRSEKSAATLASLE